jgi:hypothetical protein
LLLLPAAAAARSLLLAGRLPRAKAAGDCGCGGGGGAGARKCSLLQLVAARGWSRRVLGGARPAARLGARRVLAHWRSWRLVAAAARPPWVAALY